MVQQLQNRLENLERESNQHQSVLEASNKQHKAIVERLQQDKALLEVKLQSQEKDVSYAFHAEWFVIIKFGCKVIWSKKLLLD